MKAGGGGGEDRWDDDGKKEKNTYIFKKFEILDKLGLLQELKEPGGSPRASAKSNDKGIQDQAMQVRVSS